MSLARKATIFGVAWFLIYILAYLVFLAPKFIENRPKPPTKAPLQPKRVVNTIHDPYVPDECQLDSFIGKAKEIGNVGVVMVVHDENPLVILRTIRSIIENSQDIPLTIVLIDDYSVSPVKEWTEWSTIEPTVTILRTSKYRGISESRNVGLHQLKDKAVKTVVFLEVGAIVSDNWLWPLLETMENHPKSVVYPAVDLLEDHTGKIYPSDNAVATFDWSLKLLWEVISPNSPLRMPLLPSPPISRVEPLLSPALPPTYAASVDFLLELGGLATTALLSPWGSDNIELSLRIWLCTDGLVIRQPCSRIAMRRCVNDKSSQIGKFEICSDSGTQTGYTQLEGDRDAMSLAELWLVTREHKETVYKHRMLGRLPSQVNLREDARHPEFLNNAKLIDISKCNNFDWYLQHVFPGLGQDKVELLNSYEKSSSSSKIREDLSPILSQYAHSEPLFSAAQDKIIHAPEKSAVEVSLKAQEESRKEEIIKSRVRDEYLCLNVNEQKCAEAKRAGECQSNIGKTMFTCPKECGFCSPQNELCIDFFLMKCPKQAADGQCTNPETQTWMSQNCRRSCHLCRQIGDPQLPNEEPKGEEKTVQVTKEIEHPKETTAEEKEQYLLQNLVRIDPYVAQKQWAAGKLPDPEGTPCALAATDHAKLLNYIHVSPDPPMDGVGVPVAPDPNRNGNRIFCAVYTMEENHQTNIQMMRSTWAKRCDGWVAFSTKTDESIPAIEIHHEGPEAYNNMWQKSRSIWKYIAHHYKDEFDWFLIGGDDMYYIVSNLRHFLSSESVQEARAQKKGMFIGRRFFPPRQVEFNSGGAGYILDRESLQVLGDHLDGAPCFPHQVGFWEDVNIANCLLKTHEIKPFDTRDQYGRERFHPFQPANHLLYTVPKNPDWYKLYNPDLKIGLECCAQDSVSFHYAKAPFMQKLHSYLYHCPAKLDLKH